MLSIKENSYIPLIPIKYEVNLMEKKHVTDEFRKKRSELAKQMWANPEFRQKMSEMKKGSKNYFYGKHHTIATKEKMSKRKRGKNHPFYGKKRPEHSKRMQGSNNPFYGKHHTEESKRKISELAHNKTGDKNPFWKGDSVGYGGVHIWLRKHFGNATTCEFCESKKNIQWSNKSGKYIRNRTDWQQLCASCHSKYDESWKNTKRNKDTGRFMKKSVEVS